MKFIVEIIYSEVEGDPVVTELVRDYRGVVMRFATDDEADAYAEANNIGDYDVHDLDEIIPPDEEDNNQED